jgi:hypothetical protein
MVEAAGQAAAQGAAEACRYVTGRLRATATNPTHPGVALILRPSTWRYPKMLA